MFDFSSKKPNLIDAGAILLFIIAGIALLLREDSVDSAKAVFVTGIILLITSVIMRLKQHYFPVVTPDSSRSETEPLPFLKSIEQSQVEEMLQNFAIVDHEKLIGVDEVLSGIKDHLFDKHSSWIISLFGEGGIGKTAIAYEAIKQYSASGGFTRVAWVSAKQRYFSEMSQTRPHQEMELQWADLIKQAADQLNLEMGYSRTGWLDDFQKSIRNLEEGEKFLIIIDNLETIEDVQVINFLDNPTSPIINPHKFLITTRRSVQAHSTNVVELPLTGLKTQSAIKLVRYLGRGNPDILSANKENLKPILDVSEGNPLLIKLIVNRFLVSKKPLSMILSDMKEVSSTSLGTKLKEFLFVQSLMELEQRTNRDYALQLMNAFCPSIAGEKLTYQKLFEYSGIDNQNLFDTVLQLACSLSLIRVSGLESMYSIHSLLWEFTCRSDEEKND